MLAYLDAQKGSVQKLLTSIVEAINDPEKLQRANVRDLATAYGIFADKYLQAAQARGGGGAASELLKSLQELERKGTGKNGD